MRISYPLAVVAALLAALALANGAAAQTIPKEKGPARTIGLFSFLCLTQLPDLNGIERAAGLGEFDQLTGDDLKPYAPQVPAEKLFAWRYHDHGEQFILTAAQSKPDDAFKKQMPAFANATNTACSLLVPSKQPDPLLGELTRTMGRAADETWQEGAMRVHAWTHKRDDALSYVHYYVPEKAGATAVLSASVFVNK
jgi:hypothetical protein